jgi:hypothetical protein
MLLSFDPGSVHVGFVVDKVAMGQVFPRVLRFSPCQFHSTGAPILGKTKKKTQIIFIIGLHNKPKGRGAFVASAAGPLKNLLKYLARFCSKAFKFVKIRACLSNIFLNVSETLILVVKKIFH